MHMPQLTSLLRCSTKTSLVVATTVTCLLSTFLIISQNQKLYVTQNIIAVNKLETVTDSNAYQTTPIPRYSRRVFGRTPMSGGRLGNDMFVYASIVGIADTNRMAPVYQSKQLEEVFEVTAALKSYKGLGQASGTITEESAFKADRRFSKLLSTYSEDVTVTGWLQSFKYFVHCKDSIRREFTFRSQYQFVADNVLRSVARKHSRSDYSHVVFVAVHIRRTDMLEDYNTAKGFTVADQAYLERAVSYMTEKLRLAATIVYVVCSDDFQWATRHFQLAVVAASRGKNHVTVDYVTNPARSTNISSKVESSKTSGLMTSLNVTLRAPSGDDVSNIVIVFSVGYTGEQDLAILSKCNHTIMTVGTYGWWAGFLSGGTTIYYKDFPKKNSHLSMLFSKEDFFPPDWIAL